MYGTVGYTKHTDQIVERKESIANLLENAIIKFGDPINKEWSEDDDL